MGYELVTELLPFFAQSCHITKCRKVHKLLLFKCFRSCLPFLLSLSLFYDLSPHRQPIHQRGCFRGSTRPAAQDRNNTVPLNRHSVDNTKVTDHHAIIPTGEAPLGLSTDETTIYQMVVNRFAEAFSQNSEEERMQVRFTDGTNTFTWKACRQISLGWKAVQKSCPVYRCPKCGQQSVGIYAKVI